MLIAILGVAGGILAAVIGAWAALRARHPREAALELVDVSVVSNRRTEALYSDWPEFEEHICVVVLDAKLRNVGGQIAVLKRLHVHVEQADRLGPERGRLASALESSGTYCIDLPEPYEVSRLGIRSRSRDLSQAIPPGEADRFQIELIMRIPSGVRYFYRIRLTLDCNTDDHISSDSLSFTSPADLPV